MTNQIAYSFTVIEGEIIVKEKLGDHCLPDLGWTGRIECDIIT